MISLGDEYVISEASASKKRIRSEKRVREDIALADPVQSLRLMFDLLNGFEPRSQVADKAKLVEVSQKQVSKPGKGSRLVPFSSLIGVAVLADKYDLPWLPRLLCDYLWELAMHDKESALLVYRVALHLKRGSLARHAVSHFSGHPKPAALSVDFAAEVGVEGWHILIVAAETCKPFDWQKLARNLDFPKE